MARSFEQRKASDLWVLVPALVDFLTYSGPVQGGLRWAFGWRSAKDFAFPDVHSLGFATAVLAAAF